MKTLCGLDCSRCELKNECGGCIETEGHPFGGSCMIAVCCKNKGCENCGRTFETPCKMKEQLIAEFNALGIEDMEKVTTLNALHGAYINLKYTLPSGQKIKFWDDDRIYLGNQICKKTATDVTVSQPMRIIFWSVSMEITVPMPKSSFTRNGCNTYG